MRRDQIIDVRAYVVWQAAVEAATIMTGPRAIGSSEMPEIAEAKALLEGLAQCAGVTEGRPGDSLAK